MPKISVIMPAYNAEAYLKEAIDSILNQTYSDFEFIIINDCSTDLTEEIIKSYSDKRIVYIKNEHNMGVAATLNRGLEIAKGEYIARMDADDISLPERFAEQVRFMDLHDEVSACGTWIELIGAKNGEFRNTERAENATIDLLFTSCIAHPSAFIRKSMLGKLKYDKEFEGVEDYALWYKLSRQGKITNIPKVLLKYRIHEHQVTQNYNYEYIERMTRLKEYILQDLNIEFTKKELDAYTAYSINKIDYNEYIVALCTIFNKIYEKAPARYNLKILKKTFKCIILRGYEKQNEHTKKELLRKAEFMSNIDFFKFDIRKFVKGVIVR